MVTKSGLTKAGKDRIAAALGVEPVQAAIATQARKCKETSNPATVPHTNNYHTVNPALIDALENQFPHESVRPAFIRWGADRGECYLMPSHAVNLHVIVCVLGYWGKGKEIAEAIANCLKAGAKRGEKALVYVTNDAGAYIDSEGSRCYGPGCFCELVGAVKMGTPEHLR